MKQKLVLTMLLLVVAISCKKDKSTSPDITKGLISYFNFDDNVVDQQGYASISVGNASYSLGKIGKAISFDGINQAVVFTASPSKESDAFSVSFWMKGDASPDQYLRRVLIFNNDVDYGAFAVDNQNIFNYYIGNQNGGIPYTLTPQTWLHVVGINNGNNTQLYINGASAGTLAVFGGVSAAYFKLLAIAYDSSNNRFWSGSIDELRIYNRAITPEEVTQLYNLK